MTSDRILIRFCFKKKKKWLETWKQWHGWLTCDKARLGLGITEIFKIPSQFWKQYTDWCNLFIIFVAYKILRTLFWCKGTCQLLSYQYLHCLHQLHLWKSKTFAFQFQYHQVLGMLCPSYVHIKKYSFAWVHSSLGCFITHYWYSFASHIHYIKV